MSIIIPSRARPDNIKRFAEAYRKTNATEPVTILLNDDDKYISDYFNTNSDFWLYIAEDSSRGIGGIMNEYFSKNPKEDYYAILADDVLPETEHWDIILKQACLESKGVSWGDDGLQGAGLPTHPFISGDLVRALGYIAHPKLKHCYIDDCWLAAYNVLGGCYMPNIKLTHMHHLIGKAPMDDTYKNQPPQMEDYQVFRSIQEEYLLELLNAKRKLNESSGNGNNQWSGQISR